MNIWVDDIRPAPEGWVWCKSVEEVKNQILYCNYMVAEAARKGEPIDKKYFIDIISLDHDSGDYYNDGGDYIEFLKWYEWLRDGGGSYTKFHFHSMNPVGVQNMRAIIEHNNWTEIFSIE